MNGSGGDGGGGEEKARYDNRCATPREITACLLELTMDFTLHYITLHYITLTFALQYTTSYHSTLHQITARLLELERGFIRGRAEPALRLVERALERERERRPPPREARRREAPERDAVERRRLALLSVGVVATILHSSDTVLWCNYPRAELH